MSVEDLIKDAEYGIDQLKSNPVYYSFYLRAELATLKGITDYLLEEYNGKYSLGITLDENLKRKIF